MDSVRVLRDLSVKGFSLIERNPDLGMKDLRAMIDHLNPLKATFGRLQSRRQAEARLNTFSARHGLGQLPPHSDGANLPVPPRYFALIAPRPRVGATLIYDLDDVLPKLEYEADRAIFYLQERHSLFPTPFKTRSPDGEPIYRFNPDIMSPANQSAERVFETLSGDDFVPVQKVDWSLNIAVFIDNWTMLHGRESVPLDGQGIFRCSIWIDL